MEPDAPRTTTGVQTELDKETLDSLEQKTILRATKSIDTQTDMMDLGLVYGDYKEVQTDVTFDNQGKSN